MTTDLKPFDKIWRKTNDRYVATRKKEQAVTTKSEKRFYNHQCEIYKWMCDEMREAFKLQEDKT